MPRTTTAFAAAVALFLPIGRPLLIGLAPAVGIGSGLLSTQTAFAQYIFPPPSQMTARDWFFSGTEKAYEYGDYQGAIDDYTKAIEMRPNYAYAIWLRGDSKEMLGDLKGACIDYRKAAEIGDQEAASRVTDRC